MFCAKMLFFCVIGSMATFQKTHGIFLLDKDSGMTSNRALQMVKKIYNAKKAGHTGCLDPLASGMLPICLGEATKIASYLLSADKCYIVTGCLGITTTTGDSEGEETSRMSDVAISLEAFTQTLASFQGSMTQIPPMYSALKHQGRPLYHWARRGIEIEREPRSVSIQSMQLLHFEIPFFTAELTVSKGTYLRTWVEDLGKALGVGAYVTQLRRRFVSPYCDNSMISLETLQALSPLEQCARLVPPASALPHLPEILLNARETLALRYGQTVHISNPEQTGLVRLHEPDHAFFGIGEIDACGTLISKRLVSFAS